MRQRDSPVSLRWPPAGKKTLSRGIAYRLEHEIDAYMSSSVQTPSLRLRQSTITVDTNRTCSFLAADGGSHHCRTEEAPAAPLARSKVSPTAVRPPAPASYYTLRPSATPRW